jgi:predicted TIM-barrel fold metal-dependent hydrolase
MSERQAAPLATTADIGTVVDCDVHLTERQSDFLPYLREPFNQLLTRSTGDDYGYLSNLYPTPGFLTPVTTGKVQSDTARTSEDVKGGMEMLGTDRSVITPTQNLYLACVQHDDLAAALGNAYNEWLLDKILDPNEGLYGAAVVAPQKPTEAAEEIDDRADENGIIAAFIPSGGVHPPLGNDRYEPIYAACEDNDLPLMMHNAAGTMMMNFPFQFTGLNRYLSTHVPSHSMQHMVNLADIITQGVPERYDIEFVIQEAGIGWIPYFMQRFDHEYSAKREDAPILTKPPSEYLRDQFYFTSQPVEGTDNPQYVASMVELMGGADTLLFSSDYPHLDFDHSDELLSLLRSKFSNEDIERIYGRTAMEVFAF